jgi:hypothetical protein
VTELHYEEAYSDIHDYSISANVARTCTSQVCLPCGGGATPNLHPKSAIAKKIPNILRTNRILVSHTYIYRICVIYWLQYQYCDMTPERRNTGGKSDIH